MTEIDGPDRLSRMIRVVAPCAVLDVLRHGIVCDVADELAHESQPLRSLCWHKPFVDFPVESAWCSACG